jgi:ABC-type multidrug transport system fused ATPase/permease subunit
MLVELLVMGTVYAGLIYAENSFLQDLVQVLTRPEPEDTSVLTRWLAAYAGTAIPFAVLGAVFVVGMIRVALSARRNLVSSYLYIRSRADLEREVLRHLLHREDGFYSKHSMGEILNRLEVDLARVVALRSTMADLWWAVLMILGNITFFALGDWRLSLVVILICVLGTWATHRASRPVQAADQKYFESHDDVKMDFEDYLKAVPEVQVGRLFDVILERFAVPQGSRLHAFIAWARAYMTVEFSRGASSVVALLVTVLIVMLVDPSTSAEEARRIALIPVLIHTLPRIFESVTSLVTLRTEFQMANNSVARLLEYESRDVGSEQAPPTGDEATDIVLEGVSHQYASAEGELQGGVSEATACFRKNAWSAIVGGAGSGKSTLVNLVLGRLDPQRGEVRGARDMAATLMPQRVVLLATSIRVNLMLGMENVSNTSTLSDDDLDVVEEVGLGDVCRLKALEMRPIGQGLSTEEVRELRALARERTSKAGVKLGLYEEGHAAPRRPCIDGMVKGRTNGESATKLLLEGARPGWLKALVQGPFARAQWERAQVVLQQTRNLLDIPSYQDFANLTPEPVAASVWELRRACLPFAEVSQLSDGQRMQLLRVWLTCSPTEWGADQDDADRLFEQLRADHPDVVTSLCGVLRDEWQPFDRDRIHPFLIWRDNLLFATPIITNQRQRRRLDGALLELMKEEPWNRFFVSQGIEFDVGRSGSRLSGGQGQLVALTRSVLRRTPLLVLDEPTSALDPASRDRVAAFLGRWSPDRIVITISHDPDLVRHADEIHVMQGGRHVCAGTHEELMEQCSAFQDIFRRKN